MTTDGNGRVAGTVTQRAHAAYANDDAECGFVEAEGDGAVPNFFQQYSQTYFCRLAEVRRFFQQAAPDAYVSLSEVPAGTASTVIGVIYKQMPLKPSVLREYAGDVMLPVPEVKRANYVSDEDRVFIEDETGRTELCLASAGDKDGLVSGAVVAVRGTQMEDGRLRVDELRYPPTAPPPPPSATTLPKSADASADTEPLYACFLSDIDPTAARAQLLLDYLTGNLGIDLPRVRRIARVVIAGNIGDSDAADAFLANLAASVPVDLLPGDRDPVCSAWPQRPFHRILLPRAATTGETALTRCSNPHAFTLHGRRFLGTSGQNVDNLMRFSSVTSTTEALHRLLRYRHVAPTAPDTLACQPVSRRDPLLIRHLPQVFFSGNADAFAAQTVSLPLPSAISATDAAAMDTAAPAECASVLLLSVPRYAVSGAAVLLDLRTLQTQLLQVDDLP